MNRIKIVGLTGQSGAGKSTVSAYFAKNGMCVINADEIVKNLYTPDSVCLKAVSGVFGQDIILSDGNIDRPLLAKRAFSRKKAHICSIQLFIRLLHMNLCRWRNRLRQTAKAL